MTHIPNSSTDRLTGIATTPEAIRAERARLAAAIRKSDERLRTQWTALTAPPEAENQLQLWINRAQAAYSVYDGFMTGYKLLRRLNVAIPWRKKEKKRRTK